MARSRPPHPSGGGGPPRRPGGNGKGGPPKRRPSGPVRPDHSPNPAAKRRASDGPKPAARNPRRKQPASADGAERLQKALAHAGIGSRRACEELITQGRITVNGKVVRELGTKVHPRNDTVAVDGQPIKTERIVYFAVNKPKGYVSTNNDPSGRPRVVDILPEIPQRVYTVGRLDEMSVGLMILTNDGELANKLAHPKYGVEKVYRAVVAGTPTKEVLDKLVEGVWLAEGKVRAKRVKPIASKGEATVLEMVLAEGKNREVRRMLAKLGHKVMSLSRVAIGPVTLKGLKPGEWRPLTSFEVDLLEKVAAGIPVTTRYKPREERGPSAPRRGPSKYGETGGPARPQRPRPVERDEGEPRKPGPRAAGGRPRPAQGPGAPPRPNGPGARRAPVPPSPAPRSRAPREDEEMPTRRIIGMPGGDRPMTPRRPGPPKRFSGGPPAPSGPRPKLKRPPRAGGPGPVDRRRDDDES
jgi:23S rRNA pseudouridine2605 synthase